VLRRLSLAVIGFASFMSMAVPPAGAISNGVKQVNAPSWIAYITTNSKLFIFQTEESSCTGQVVSSEWVLTAAHCVVRETRSGQLTRTPIRANKFSVVLGRVQLNQSLLDGGQFRVNRVVISPYWDPRCICSDAALLHLTHSVEGVATAVPLASSLPVTSKGIQAFGYGFIRETWSQYAVRYRQIWNYSGENANFLMATQKNSYSYVESCTSRFNVCFDHTGKSMIRNGDSGGPWIKRDHGIGLFGVTSYSNYYVANNKFHFPRVMATNLTFPPLRRWISRTANLYPFHSGAIYQAGADSLAWLKADGAPAVPIRRREALVCLMEKYPLVQVTALQITELERNERATPATCNS